MFFKNLWLKLTNSNEFRAQKFLKIREKAKREYETKFSKEIEEIHRKINNQKKLNFLHSGHAADIVNLLPVIKELSLEHECNLFKLMCAACGNFYIPSGILHNFFIFDPDQPVAPQFAEIDFVIDIGGSVGTREMVDAAAHRCRMWQIHGTGLDPFDMDYWRSKNIPVCNCPGPFSAVALSECAMMFILMLTRRYNQVKDNLEKGVMYRPFGFELDGLRLGIVGLGASGTELAQRAVGFGLCKICVSPEW